MPSSISMWWVPVIEMTFKSCLILEKLCVNKIATPMSIQNFDSAPNFDQSGTLVLFQGLVDITYEKGIPNL